VGRADVVPIAYVYWQQPVLPRIGKTLLVETHVINSVLRYAGTVDCVALLDGIPTVIDWKTTSKCVFVLEREKRK
jgi:hypothetical protein